MMHAPLNPSDTNRLRLDGIKNALGIPATGIFANMLGFAAIAREAGFDINQALTTSVLVWGVPGQVAMASLYMTGASALVIFTAVALANMRIMLMVASSINMIGLKGKNTPLWKKLLLMQMLAMTSWVFVGAVQHKYTKSQLRQYFLGFAPTVYTAGLLGTALGYHIADYVNTHILQVILVITPLYLLMMVANARHIPNRYAGLIGGLIAPITYPTIGEWSIMLGGFIGGTAIIAKRYHQQKTPKKTTRTKP